jgi:hypothetical protein
LLGEVEFWYTGVLAADLKLRLARQPCGPAPAAFVVAEEVAILRYVADTAEWVGGCGLVMEAWGLVPDGPAAAPKLARAHSGTRVSHLCLNC